GMTTSKRSVAPALAPGGTRRTPPSTTWRPADGHRAGAPWRAALPPAPHAASAAVRTRAPARERRTVTTRPSLRRREREGESPPRSRHRNRHFVASRRRAFCTEGSASLTFASGRARTSTLAGLAAIVISSPVAGLRPCRAL